MLRLIILSLMLAVLTWFNRSGSEKSSLSEPSLIQLTMNMSAWDGSDAQKPASSSASFHIEGGSLSLSNLAFHGIKQDGKEFHFTKDMNRSYTLQTKNLPISILEFDVPKGNYQSASLILHANGRDTLPGMMLKGHWHRGDYSIPLEIRFFHYPEIFSIPLSHSGPSLHLAANGVSTLQIHVQPDAILKALHQTSLQDFKFTDTDAGRKLIISRQHNPHIHAVLVNSAEKSIKAYIQ
jgi:hypothetical protein